MSTQQVLGRQGILLYRTLVYQLGRVEFPMKKRVSALTIKPGPTESGIEPVGGDVVSTDKLALLSSQSWLLLLLLLVPLGFLLYRKRYTLLARLLAR